MSYETRFLMATRALNITGLTMSHMFAELEQTANTSLTVNEVNA